MSRIFLVMTLLSNSALLFTLYLGWSIEDAASLSEAARRQVSLHFLFALAASGFAYDLGPTPALVTVRPSDQLADLDRREQQLALLDTLTLTTALLGVAAATTGTVLLFTGDDPDRYDTAVSPASSGVSAQFIAGPSGVGLSGRF